MAINYHLFCFTNWVEIDMRVNVGNSVIIILIAQTLMFLLWAMIPAFDKCKLTC